MDIQTKTKICRLVNEMPLEGIQKYQIKQKISEMVGEDIVVKTTTPFRPGNVYRDPSGVVYLVVYDNDDLNLIQLTGEGAPRVTGFCGVSQRFIEILKMKYLGQHDFSTLAQEEND